MAAKKPIRIIFADDHQLFRRAFRRIMAQEQDKEIEFIEEASEGSELIEKVIKYRPDLVITDVKMPGIDGIQACKIIKQRTKIGVIALSAFNDDQYLLEMINAGATGLLSKNSSIEEVIEAIKTVNSGQSFYCSTISEKLYGILKSSKQKQKNIEFTLQEIKVMQLICKQLTSREIALLLKLNLRTVEDYRYRIQEKTGAKNVVGIALFAIFNNIVRQSDI